MDAGADFRRVAAAALADLLRLWPERATALGVHDYDHLVDDRSEAGRREQLAVLARHRGALDGLDRDALGVDERVDAEILANELDRLTFAVAELAEPDWNPLVYNVGELLHPFVDRSVLPVEQRVRAIAARLALVPDLLLLARRQLSRPPAVHVQTALMQHDGVVAAVVEGVDGVLEQAPGLRPLVEAVRDPALAALEEHARHLRELSSREGEWRLGRRRYERKLALTLHSRLGAERVAELARQHIVEVTEAMHATAVELLGGTGAGERRETVRRALDRVAEDRPDASTIVGLCRAALDEATETVRRLGIATVPDDEVSVGEVPAFRRGIAAAYCDPPGPFDDGGRTLFMVSPTPADWPAERVRSFYREYNTAMLVNLTVHEAMPGHAVQLGHWRRFRGPTDVRRVVSSGSFVEGWAVHAERLMAEAGHGGPAVRLQQQKMQLRMAINAVLDVEVHAGDLDEAGALQLMTGPGFQEEGEAVGKWRRACLTSAQLATYFVGYTELCEPLAGLGPSYDAALAHGCPPPGLLPLLLGGAGG